MKFLLLVIPKNFPSAPADFRPDPARVEAMGKFNAELEKAGVLLDLNGLHPPASAVRVHFEAGKAVVRDGPFAEAKEAIGGYWMIQVRSKDEAVAWATRVPAGEEVIEVRQIHDPADFAPKP